ncbi:MAG: hypothetical protein A2Y76_09280 [Planctomycetes bacterium RBG_13_60_9]|nr:MAG: hypothetical protein A2Y76_09280 [Planctomycetes bacterium RBG_13_60_9]
MFRYLTMTVVWCTVAALSADTGSKIDNHVKIALLPVKQDNMPKGWGITDEKLSAALHVEFTKAADFELVEFSDLDEQFENELVEDALFELLVTDDLTETLQRLEAFETNAGKRKAHTETAKRLHIQYLAEVTIEGHRGNAEINYRLTDAENNRVVLAKSFGHVSHDGGSIARETAKRMTRDLWRLKHSEN